MKKLLLIITVFFAHQCTAMQKEHGLSRTDQLVSQIQSGDQPTSSNTLPLSTHIHILIREKKYGPELARVLDTFYDLQHYMYYRRGFYIHKQKQDFIHNIARDLCEPGVTIEQAEATNHKMWRFN
jgi:hypothetical protein